MCNYIMIAIFSNNALIVGVYWRIINIVNMKITNRGGHCCEGN